MRTVESHTIGALGESALRLGPSPRFLCALPSVLLPSADNGLVICVEDDLNPPERHAWRVVAYPDGAVVTGGGFYVGTGGSRGALRHVYAYKGARS